MVKDMFIVTDDSGSEYGTKKFTPNEYIYVRVKDTVDVQIKKDEEGVSIDLYPIRVVDEPVATTWCLYSEAEDYDKHKDDPFYVSNVFGNEYGTERYNEQASGVGQEFLYVKVRNLTVQIQCSLGDTDDAIIISVFDGTTDEDVDELASTTASLNDFIEK